MGQSLFEEETFKRKSKQEGTGQRSTGQSTPGRRAVGQKALGERLLACSRDKQASSVPGIQGAGEAALKLTEGPVGHGKRVIFYFGLQCEAMVGRGEADKIFVKDYSGCLQRRNECSTKEQKQLQKEEILTRIRSRAWCGGQV
jgi:hypothetical protein